MYAPIVIFEFNRLDSLKGCIDSLLTNNEAKESNLIVYVDGPRTFIKGESEKVDEVREFVRGIKGFKSLETHFALDNKRLGPSIITGVTDVINRYGRAIVIEDDLIVSCNLLAFMNYGLEKYENDPKVWSVCGYSNKICVPKNYEYDAYFCTRSSSWGWATWKDRWNSCDWRLTDWSSVDRNRHLFNQWGGSDCFRMLRGWKEGRNQSWAIRFCYNQFVHNAISLFPITSKISNEGFDGRGTNCRFYNRFKYVFDDIGQKTFLFPEEIVVNQQIRKEVIRYHSIKLRIYSRIMNFLYKYIKLR